MAKDKSDLSKEERKALKAAKKAEKSTIADAGVNGSSKHKSDKKEKKDKKKREALAEKALNSVNGDSEDVNVVVKEKKLKASKDADSDDEDATEITKVVVTKPIGALVPFAVPLADDKAAKKVFKSVKKGGPCPQCCHLSPVMLTLYSRRPAHPQARCKRSRQIPPQVAQHTSREQHHHRPHSYRCPRCRHLPHGRYQPYPRALRRPQHSLHLRTESCRAGFGRWHEAADECGDGRQGHSEEERWQDCRRGG